MPKTVKIRDLSDEVHAALVKQAAEAGITVPDLLKREATRLAARLAARPLVEEWLERTRRRPSEITPAMVRETLDELRGDWPDASR